MVHAVIKLHCCITWRAQHCQLQRCKGLPHAQVQALLQPWHPCQAGARPQSLITRRQAITSPCVPPL